MPLQRWVIVGGEDRGGILVREGQELGSPKVGERLSTGAVVEEVALIGERLRFRRLTGNGPKEGWISICLDHKDLAQKLPEGATSASQSKPNQRPAAPAPTWSPDEDFSSVTLALGDVNAPPPPVWERPSEPSPGASSPHAGQASEEGKPQEGSWEQHDWHQEEPSSEPKPPPRFESSSAAKLPVEVSFDLKWLVWNEIWRVVNNKMGSLQESEEKRKVRFSQAEKDEERSCAHLRRALELNIFSNNAILQVKRQASQGGHAVAQGIAKGIWLYAARCEALEPPREMEAPLWNGLVKAVRTAAVTIFYMAKEEHHKASGFQQDFELAWNELEEYSPPDPY